MKIGKFPVVCLSLVLIGLAMDSIIPKKNLYRTE